MRGDRPRSRPVLAARRSVGADFRVGLSAPLHALRYVLGRPRLWKYSVIGAAISIAIFAVLAALGVAFAAPLAGLLWARPEALGLAILWWLVTVLIGAVLVAASLGVTLVLATIVMAPMYDALSSVVEHAVLDNEAEYVTTIGSLGTEARQGIFHGLFTLLVYALCMVPVLALNLIPGAGSVVAAVAGFLVSASMMAMEFSDHPQSRRRFRWIEKASLIRREWPVFLGLGVGVGGMLLIPVTNFLLAPVAVVAGTMVFCALDERNRVPFADRRVRKEKGAVESE